MEFTAVQDLYNHFCDQLCYMMKSGANVIIQSDGDGDFNLAFSSTDDFETFRSWFDTHIKPVAGDDDACRWRFDDLATSVAVRWDLA